MYLKKRVIEIEKPEIIFRPEDADYLEKLISLIDNPRYTFVTTLNSLKVKNTHSVNICNSFRDLLDNIKKIKDSTDNNLNIFIETLKHYLEQAIEMEENNNVCGE